MDAKVFFVPGLFAGHFCSKITQSPPPPSNVKWSAAKLGLCRPATQNILTFFRRLCVSEEVGLCDCGSSLITEVDINKFRLCRNLGNAFIQRIRLNTYHLVSLTLITTNKQTNKKPDGLSSLVMDFFFKKANKQVTY